MRDDANELAKAENRDPPRRIAFGQRCHPGPCGCMLRQLLAMRIHENIGVDGDHPRPSMRS